MKKTLYKTKSGMIGHIINIHSMHEWATIKCHTTGFCEEAQLAELEEVEVDIK
jgi:hypothetical protein